MPPNKFNRAMRIDSLIANPLQHLPPQTVALPNCTPGNDVRRNLAFRNLTRARMVKLATGQQMATFLKNKGVNLTKLTKAQIRDGNGGADLSGLTQTQRQAVLRDTPAVALRPARGGAEQRPAQGRGRAHRGRDVPPGDRGQHALDRARHGLRAELGPNSSTFRMVDLLLFAFEGKKTLLNPNG